jgi:hypothetical protein
MSFVLSVVCVKPVVEPRLPVGVLLIHEAVQDSGASGRAAYVAGLSKFFDYPVGGRAYLVQLPCGSRYPTSRDFFHYPEDDPGDTKPIVIHFGDEYRAPFDALLHELLAASSLRRVLVVAEWNGDVTNAMVSRAEIMEDLAAGDVFLHGPWSRAEFWVHHDQGLVFYPSVVVVQEPAPKGRTSLLADQC